MQLGFHLLSKFANYETKSFKNQALYRVTKRVTKNFKKVIDRNYYTIPEAKTQTCFIAQSVSVFMALLIPSV